MHSARREEGEHQMMKQAIGSHSKSFQLLENFINYELPHLCTIKQFGLPSDIRDNPNNRK